MKNTVKKVLAVFMALAMFLSFAACSSNGNDSQTLTEVVNTEKSSEEVLAGLDKDKEYKIGVIQYTSHPSLDNCFKGVEEALKESGIKYTLDRQIGSTNAPDSDCDTYAKNMVAKNYDIIYAIATPAATIAYAATEGTDIPVIFCAVSDPVKAKLVKSVEEPGELCTGTSDILDLRAQVELIKSMQPDVKSIGILYTTSESNSISNLERLKEICAEQNIEVVATGIQNDSDIPSAAAALASKVDCINNFTDNKVVTNLEVVLDAANEAGIPVYGSEVEQVKNGCLAAVSIDYIAVGKATGYMGIDVLGGADISKVAVKTIKDSKPVVNEEVLASFKFELPDAYKDAEKVKTNTK